MRRALPISMQLRRQLGKAAHRHQAGQPVAMQDRIAQGDQAAEADAAEKDRGVAEFVDQETKGCDLVVLS